MICKICGQDVKNKGITSHKAAKKNKLNYIVLWNKTDIEQFMKDFTNY